MCGKRVSGTMIAGNSAAAGSGLATQPVTINPLTSLDFANNALKVPSSSGFKTGQTVVYDAGGGGDIGGLVSGNTYYVVVPTGLANEIQLAARSSDATAGKIITFDTYPTLTAGPLTVPVTLVDETTGSLNFGFNPGFSNGQALTYHTVAGKRIGGLVDGAIYYAIVDAGSPSAIKLADAPNGASLPLNLNPQFDGFRQSLPVTVNPNGQPNTIKFGFKHGFVFGDHFVYQGAGISYGSQKFYALRST